MGLFKKPNRKFRQRETQNDSEDENGNAESSEKTIPKPESKEKTSTFNVDNKSSLPSTSNSKEKSDSSIPKPSKLLSFQDEEDDGEVFKLKKSNYSRRLAKQREREKKKKEESTLPEKKPQDVDRKFDIPSASSVVKPKDSWDVLSGNAAEDMEVDSDEEKEKMNPFKNVLQSGIIPDAATIYAMKKHRQMAREMGDFIPVEEPEKDDEEKSRLVRDDDNDRSDDDEDDEPSRMSFTVNTGAVERQKIRETFLSLQEDTANKLENEDAAELDRWEQEQIRKGVGVTQVGPQSSTVTEEQLYYASSAAVPSYAYNSNTNEMPNASSVQPPLEDILKKTETSLTTSDIKARLEERLSTLKKIHESHKQELIDCDTMLEETKELVVKLEEEAPQRAQNFSLYQQMSGYVKDLVECLDLKVAHIDQLEGKMMDLYKARTQRLISRRQLDIRDQSDEYSTISSDILKGVSAEFLNEKISTTDEMKLRRIAEREGRRMRRRKQRERSMMIVKHHDGISTDDEELDIEITKFNEAKALIIDEANTIFDDVVEEFGTLEGVMSNFEKWRTIRPDTYSEAFVPMCLPKIFGTFVRISLLRWNPLKEDIVLEDKNWFRQILNYGFDEFEEESNDPDFLLLPAIIEKIVIPKITGFIQNVWDPLSRKETTKLINLIKSFSEDYPSINGKSKQLQNCFKAVSTRIHKCLDDDIFVPLYPKELLENRSLGAADFFQRQFWSTVKLMQNILLFEDLIAEQPLQHLALSSLLNRYLLMGLHTSIMLRDTIDKCKAIVGSFPRSWFKNSKGTTTLPLLKQFSAFLVKFADTIYTFSVKRGVSEEDTIKDIVQLLVLIESLEDAVNVAKKYNVSAFKN